ncbi:ABC transporter ATP-binding protein [Phenylobacterium sp.]|uniref:ABC transporter ATP-binding protein n=1 Tax=Phenylobacterium sp. TaxID=1871053 RepID=UPI0027300D79|nr:ATP-binding cassette domain-containing protein [Phenylobacterium sp.]MDP1616177.1 ATP-binding cassette domain-containing protein [Phenylobacterium sp.]MDP1988183.1 ATP-binding cassette domain-containing protein [Phenylobacterium sp.]
MAEIAETLGAGLRVRLAQAGPIPLDVDLACPPGQLHAIVGPSGAGKTTLLKAIAGLYRPQAGQITSDGMVWFDSAAGTWLAPQARRVGLVFQAYALFPHMSAQANVETSLAAQPRAARAARALALLTQVGLADKAHRRPADLSGGEQQRVALARALARSPDVLLLDEPFAAVDRRTRRRLQQDLATLRESLKIPILLVTHDLDEACALADQMSVLHEGRVLQTGAPDQVMARPASPLVAELLDLNPG